MKFLVFFLIAFGHVQAHEFCFLPLEMNKMDGPRVRQLGRENFESFKSSRMVIQAGLVMVEFELKRVPAVKGQGLLWSKRVGSMEEARGLADFFFSALSPGNHNRKRWFQDRHHALQMMQEGDQIELSDLDIYFYEDMNEDKFLFIKQHNGRTSEVSQEILEDLVKNSQIWDAP